MTNIEIRIQSFAPLRPFDITQGMLCARIFSDRLTPYYSLPTVLQPQNIVRGDRPVKALQC
jgi:hypothetical protein